MNITFLNNVIKLFIERRDFFLSLLIQHIYLTFLAISIITLVGIALGIYMTRNKVVASFLMGVVNIIYTIPSIALFGFLVAVTGIGNKTALIALCIYGLLPMIRNTFVGINEVDPFLIQSAIGMGSTDSQLLFKVQIPLAIPVIFAGFRTMVVMTIALGGIASFIGAGGLGVAIWRGITTNFPVMTFAGSLLVALLAFTVDFMLLFISGCQAAASKTVVVASKPHAEQYILAEMITLLIENHTDILVEKKLGIGGGTSNIHPGMINGEIDIYPEYTGTGLLFVLKEDLITDPQELYSHVKDRYEEEYEITWLDIYGFNNTYALAIKEEVANQYNLETYDDLAQISDQLVFGAEYDFFEREDGYNGLNEIYGFNFRDLKEMDIGLKYEAIGSGQVDVINAFSTDGLLLEYDLKVLEDNRNFFPSYQAATLIRKETLERYPELEEVLQMMSGQITDEDMIQMNYYVENENRDPEDVAEEFLREKGLI